ncbi:MAG TPA: TIGR04282 family arsenosugar biosynthesis glycosyltransferase [Spirochaetota bacterium]|nr:TIGR04282 family arsenosugar biosynthesis glycosyltransferase [Spirochaetota bacterium]HPC42232.1 TIGR04282 family arsenosugar biosynthesis glycosyltransferase [Spirochaetota bacterium]HPL17091.1 TIGR04282 family arsenosugar biosynthesis glycosyltransferase [Spirochaetota bacterium]HQF08198.1 TIGR04282 family arsenosugar biosynthesis glycosyltransferase [Spirochaetota bacterium]HQH97187.1 TIGR04282 family arsenosugar biosynthesis glycosyltransferase [Spirochaetota bacterium]
MNKDAVILFLRYPERGKMKVRLAQEVGDDLAFELHVRFIRDILNTLRAVNAETIIVGTGSTGKGPPGIFGKSIRLVQRGHNFGERLHNAFADVFYRGFDRAALIGIECPGLRADYIRQALGELGNHDAVIGPDRDGGYGLLALHGRSLRAEFFEDIPWGTARVFVETVGKIEDALLELSILDQMERVNGVEDLVRLAGEGGSPAIITRQFLEQHREKLMENI